MFISTIPPHPVRDAPKLSKVFTKLNPNTPLSLLPYAIPCIMQFTALSPSLVNKPVEGSTRLLHDSTRYDCPLSHSFVQGMNTPNSLYE